MSAAMATHIAARLPLHIYEAEFSDPMLLLGGQGWTLAVTCPWRITNSTVVDISWTSQDAADRVWDLIGQTIVTIRDEGRDPVFDLSGGAQLEIFSDTDADPWVLRFEGQTFVGPLRVRDDEQT